MTTEVEVVRRWFAVRCIFAVMGREEDGSQLDEEQTALSQLYEERITLWWAGSVAEAVALAEAEAKEYASMLEELPDAYLGLAQCYDLGEQRLRNGAEVFSLMRDSRLTPAAYLKTFFDTGDERQSEL